MGWFTDALYGPGNDEWDHQVGDDEIKITIYHPVNTVVLVETELAPVIIEMAKLAEGTMNAEDIKEMILTGSYKLLVIRVNGILAATACLLCMTYPRFTSLKFCYLVGNKEINSKIWAQSLKRVVAEYCDDFGIEYIEAYARKGMAELLCKTYGFKRLCEHVGMKLSEWDATTQGDINE